ncbi:HIRAN domain-containing protein [Sphingomonas sp. gentR]|uniref:HIRAN domain-containing protein n=1 Tax=Sphingomonas sp. gentR TaxID=3118768 RepID=UPI00177CAFE6
MRQLSLAVVGIDYPNKRGPDRRFELAMCHEGEAIELRPEPDNRYDEHAIAVYSCRGIQLGYLPSERAVLIGTYWRQGHTTIAIFQALGAKVGWVRVAFDGEQPILPPVAVDAPPTSWDAADSDYGFEPDWIPPDD